MDKCPDGNPMNICAKFGITLPSYFWRCEKSQTHFPVENDLTESMFK
jgi:hypothetical protein